jgi:hypothetical protein
MMVSAKVSVATPVKKAQLARLALPKAKTFAQKTVSNGIRVRAMQIWQTENNKCVSASVCGPRPAAFDDSFNLCPQVLRDLLLPAASDR